MQTEALKTFIVHSIAASSALIDCMTELLPAEVQEKASSARMSMLSVIHEVTGELLNMEKDAKESGNPQQTKINIE